MMAYAIRDCLGMAVSVIAADSFADAVRIKHEMQAFHNSLHDSDDIFTVGPATRREMREHEHFRAQYQRVCRRVWRTN